jgi:hypothetical protein
MPTQTALARLIRPRWSVSAILWICVLGIMASFQTWRGAYVDGVLFYAITLMLILDRLTDGRILFVGLWLAGGLSLIGFFRKRGAR